MKIHKYSEFPVQTILENIGCVWSMHAVTCIEFKSKRVFSSAISLEGNGESLELNERGPRCIKMGNFITEEELWACTSCQACVQACPVNISPMGIVLDMRRSLIMEDSKSPESITSMFNNIENNGAPWAFPAASRGDWTQES